MARPSEEFLLAWSSLSGADPEPGWQAIGLPAAGPIELRAGRRSPDNAEAVLMGFPSVRLAAADKLPEGQGFAVERADPEGNGNLWLALTRKSAGSAELFAAMACDVVGALDDASSMGADESKLLRVFIRRVGAWQEFMRKGTQALGPEAELGLVGELAVLLEALEAGAAPEAVVGGWIGPLDGPQDFHIGSGALEAKTTLSPSGFAARIGSLQQLDDSQRAPLYLAAVRLRLADTGRNLPGMVKSARVAVFGDAEAARLLEERLLAAGYLDAHQDLYIRRFAISECRAVEVGQGFPRLTPSSVPAGIVWAAYEVNVDAAQANRIDIKSALKTMGAL